jgi:hypothetical protein
MTAGWTIEFRIGHRVAVWLSGCFRTALGALFTDDSVAPHAESGHHRTTKVYAE